MFGLAVMAALMAMAFVSASSAMASSTALCNQDAAGGACPAGHLISHMHKATLSGNKAVILSSVINVACDVLSLGDVISAGLLGSPLQFTGETTYTNCNGGCTVTETEPVSGDILRIGHERATWVTAGRWAIKCGFFINCEYDGEGLEGTIQGSLLSLETNGDDSIQEQELNKVSSGAFCPVTAFLDISTTPLSATYIAG